MKRKPPSFLLFLLALACWLGSTVLKQNTGGNNSADKSTDDLDTFLAREIERSLPDQNPPPLSRAPFALPSNAVASSLSSPTKITELNISNYPRNSEEQKEDKGYVFLDSKKQKFAASKLGLDLKHHFQNCFLVGYHPFEVSEIWMPHQVLSMRLKYQLDWDQFPGFQEIWLSSYETFRAGSGDCEDHSVALADWLISMGEDARVVTGTHEGDGHAWVVVIRDTGTFLLESTSKKRRRLFSSYPLASLAKGYEPSSMFNREYYWVKDSPENTADYTGKHWIKSGRVTR